MPAGPLDNGGLRASRAGVSGQATLHVLPSLVSTLIFSPLFDEGRHLDRDPGLHLRQGLKVLVAVAFLDAGSGVDHGSEPPKAHTWSVPDARPTRSRSSQPPYQGAGRNPRLQAACPIGDALPQVSPAFFLIRSSRLRAGERADRPATSSSAACPGGSLHNSTMSPACRERGGARAAFRDPARSARARPSTGRR